MSITGRGLKKHQYLQGDLIHKLPCAELCIAKRARPGHGLRERREANAIVAQKKAAARQGKERKLWTL